MQCLKSTLSGLALGGLFLLSGCGTFLASGRKDPPPPVPMSTEVPTSAQLVTYLNENARRLPSVESYGCSLDCKQGSQSVHLNADLVCQQPRNFYLKGKVLGQSKVQLGSNDQEFWFWTSEMKPDYVFHCSYESFAKGQAEKLPFPFNPDWLMSALGMGTYDVNGRYRVEARSNTVDLIEETVTPQGQPVRKITVFHRAPSKQGKPQVAGHLLVDPQNQVICSAIIQDSVTDRETGGVMPKKVKISWPAEKVEMTLDLDDIRVVRAGVPEQKARTLFSRHTLGTSPGYDLAKGRPDSPTGIEQAGGRR